MPACLGGWDVSVLGSDGKGRCWLAEQDGDDDDESEAEFSSDPYAQMSDLRSASMHCTEEESLARSRHVGWTVTMDEEEEDDEDEDEEDIGGVVSGDGLKFDHSLDLTEFSEALPVVTLM